MEEIQGCVMEVEEQEVSVSVSRVQEAMQHRVMWLYSSLLHKGRCFYRVNMQFE